MILLQILWNDILPLMAFLAAGWIMDSKFKLDLNTYSKLTTRVVLPCFIFYSMYLYQPDSTAFFLFPAALFLLFADSVIAFITARIFGFSGGKARAFRALSTLSNAGNIGVTLILMIFSHAPYLVDSDTPYLDEARGTIILLLILMNIAINTLGASLIGSKESFFPGILKFIISMPAVYAVLAAVLARASGFHLESTFLWSVLVHFNGAFIILVTITAGAQIHRSRFGRPDLFTLGAIVNKLLLSPLMAFLIIMVIRVLPPVSAQVFFIYAAVPSSFSLILFSVDFDNQPELITQSVMYSSITGIITMTAAIWLAQYLFPAGV